jgi:SHS family lactate transporter-like MFS transporter
LSGLAPNYAWFVACRALYGVGMGGYWGIGASYAMESAPIRFRGMLSGIIQTGYPIGYLLSSVAMQRLAPAVGWRSVFFVGAPVALIIVTMTLFSPESTPWKQHHPRSARDVANAMVEHRGIFFYLLLMMSVLIFLSHGSQNLYPDFLKSLSGVAAASILSMKALYGIPVLYKPWRHRGGAPLRVTSRRRSAGAARFS